MKHESGSMFHEVKHVERPISAAGESTKASYESGVLHIRVPKKEAQKLPEKKSILIEG